MTLSTKHRSSIHQKLVPILGEEEASALLDEFPTNDHDELATKQFVRAEIAGVRAEIAQSASDLKKWTVGTMLTGMGLAFLIGQALH